MLSILILRQLFSDEAASYRSVSPLQLPMRAFALPPASCQPSRAVNDISRTVSAAYASLLSNYNSNVGVLANVKV